MYPQVFDAAKQVDQAFLIIFGFSAVILLLICGVTLFFIWRYHHSRHPQAADIEGNVLAELIWTLLPTIIVMALFYFGWTSYSSMRDAPEGAMEISVDAKMWSWIFTYSNGKRANILMAPVNTPVKLNMTSKDVIHSFFVPAMRIKMDTVPGMSTYVWFKSDETGDFDILCAEYCGLKHANMITTLKVVAQEEFDAWLAGGDEQAQGKALLDKHGCLDCHTLDGAESDGPTLQGIAGREVRLLKPDGSTEKIEVTAQYLREAILYPDKSLVEGWDDIMPPYEGDISEEDLNGIVNYLMSGDSKGAHPGRAKAEMEGCISCHSTDGSIIEGPSFKGLYNSMRDVVDADGKESKVKAGDAYLREAILYPDKVLTKDYDDVMPPYDDMPKETLDDIVDWMKTLGAPEK